MARKAELSLRNFFVFNSGLSEKEGDEAEKILFYHPSDIDIDTKVKDVGLSEAIIKFTTTFTSDDSCQALHTQKATQIFYQPEKDFWMIMTLNVPYETKLKDGSESVEYRGGDVHDVIFRAVLKQTYQMFRLFAGNFQMNFIGTEKEVKIANLKKKLDVFFSKYLLTIKLPSCDIIDVIRSIQYLPLEKFLFLRVHTFINMIEATFPAIENCLFLYNEQLVWSEVNPNDLYSIYEYLVGTVFPKTTQTELQGGSITRSYSMDCAHYGSFITGPESFQDCIKAPKVYIYNETVPTCYYLIIYRALGATICLFVDAKNPIDEDFCLELHSFMGPQLTSIASEIGESFTKGASNKPPDADNLAPKYLFVNEVSLRHTGTIYLDHRKPKHSLVPPLVMNLITDLYNEDQIDSKGKFDETVLKAFNDFWIVKKTSNWRQFYVIINNNKATLLDITNEAKKIFEQQITNVFFEK